jgi:hypothetical protein
MPSNFIATLEQVVFPINDHFDLREICQSVFERYYQSYVARLQGSGYEFPPSPRYLRQFGHHLPASLICTEKGGSVFDPGVKYRCLVFVNDGEASRVDMYIGRYVVHVGKLVQVFGEGPLGINVSLRGDVTVVVVAVLLDDVESLTSVDVLRL